MIIIKTPIYNKLLEKSLSNNIDFQLPGHKKRFVDEINYNLIPGFDTTETFDTDNLHNPEGIIRESLNQIKDIFKSRESLYIVNGSTSALHIAMMSTTNPGDKILIQRNSHISLYNGTIISKLIPEYILPNYDDESQIIGGIDPKKFEEILNKNSEIKACVLLNPSFYGICSDLKTIIDIAHSKNVIVIVDEAHGSHLAFNKRLPISAIKAGADMVIHSTHKTLPAITQTSILHICTQNIDIDKVKEVSRILQTTSPSYIFMSSIEQAIAFIDSKKGRRKLDNLLNYIKKFENTIKKIDNVNILIDSKDDLFYDRDFTKIMIEIEGISGNKLRDILHLEYGIDMEYSDLRYIIAVLSVMNNKKDLKRFTKAIKEIAERVDGNKNKNLNQSLIIPEIKMSIYDAFYSRKKLINIKDAEGRISAGYINPYPPGIPQLAPGEIIKTEHIDLVNLLNSNKMSIVGLKGKNNDLIEVIDEK